MKSQIEVILEQILGEFENLEPYEFEKPYFKGVEDCENVVKEYLKRVKTN